MTLLYCIFVRHVLNNIDQTRDGIKEISPHSAQTFVYECHVL